MKQHTLNVDELIKRLPVEYEQACYETRTIERKREIKSPADLMKLLLLYLIGGYSTIEISIIAMELGIARISDVAFIKKLSKCREWLSQIISMIIPKAVVEYTTPKSFEGYTIAALDGSNVKERGRSGRLYRLHYAIDLFRLTALSFKITGQEVGETLLNFDIKKKWLVLADRIYGSLTGINYCLNAGANFIVRLRFGAFKLYGADGKEFHTLQWLREINDSSAADVEVYVKLPDLGLTKLRLCACKIPADMLEKVARKNKRKDSKKQIKTSLNAKFMSQFVVVITALPETITADEIISMYRFRWQVEIYFKRLKSIIDFGSVPLKTEDSTHAWLTGKLMVSLLIEQMIAEVPFSPNISKITEYMEGS